MQIVLEIKNLKDWEILLPLLKRLKIKVIGKSIAPIPPKVPNPLSSKPTDGIMQFAGILSDNEAAIFETAIEESRKIDEPPFTEKNKLPLADFWNSIPSLDAKAFDDC